MGELKELRQEQESLVNRAKEINRKLWLAGLGIVSKAEEQGRAGLDRLVAAGEQSAGEEAAAQSRYLVAARGLVSTLRSEGDELLGRLTDTSRKLREEGRKVFDELVAAGEKRETGA